MEESDIIWYREMTVKIQTRRKAVICRQQQEEDVLTRKQEMTFTKMSNMDEYLQSRQTSAPKKQTGARATFFNERWEIMVIMIVEREQRRINAESG